MRWQGVPGRWGKRFCWATGCAEVRGESEPVALPKASFPRHRHVVLEPLRRVGVDPAKHGSSQPQRQATPAVVGASGGIHTAVVLAAERLPPPHWSTCGGAERPPRSFKGGSKGLQLARRVYRIRLEAIPIAPVRTLAIGGAVVEAACCQRAPL